MSKFAYQFYKNKTKKKANKEKLLISKNYKSKSFIIIHKYNLNTKAL